MTAVSERAARGPLAGKRIVLTRPAAQAHDFAAQVRALGGEPVIAPAIAIAPPESWAQADAALARLRHFDWICFTSANAAHGLIERAHTLGVARDMLLRPRLAAIGPATAAVLTELLHEPEIVADTHDAATLAAILPADAETHVLFPHGNLAGDTLPRDLARRGARVTAVVVYRTLPGPGLVEIVSRIVAGQADALVFASASAVRAVAAALASKGELPGRWPAAICIGSTTAAAARELGIPIANVARAATQADMIDSVVELFAQAQRNTP